MQSVKVKERSLTQIRFFTAETSECIQSNTKCSSSHEMLLHATNSTHRMGAR